MGWQYRRDSEGRIIGASTDEEVAEQWRQFGLHFPLLVAYGPIAAGLIYLSANYKLLGIDQGIHELFVYLAAVGIFLTFVFITYTKKLLFSVLYVLMTLAYAIAAFFVTLQQTNNDGIWSAFSAICVVIGLLVWGKKAGRLGFS